MDDVCNPFLDESFDLYSLDTKVVVEKNVTAELMQVEDDGKKQLLKFFETILHQATCSVIMSRLFYIIYIYTFFFSFSFVFNGCSLVQSKE